MKEYDVIAFGTGTAMNIVSPLLRNPRIKVAVIENEMVGGICLTRGCIPSKLILQSAHLVHEISRAQEFGVDVQIKKIRGADVLKDVRKEIKKESSSIEKGISSHPRIDFYKGTGKFVAENTVEINGKEIYGDNILLSIGSRPLIPKIDGLEDVDYITNREFFYYLDRVPKSVCIVGGGFIAAELGFFLAMMGSKVTIIGRNPQFVKTEEKEISYLLKRTLSQFMDIYTGYEVVEVRKRMGKKVVLARSRDGKEIEINAEEIIIASGRKSNADITMVEKGNIKTDKRGWVVVDEYLRTTSPNVWCFGDANGKYLYKHIANYESEIVYYNAFLGRKRKVDYSVVPHAVFTYPEVASVGMKEDEAKQNHDILVGYYKYEDTAKGMALKVKDYFVKVIVDKETYRILGAHIIGPHASILIQEIINAMYLRGPSAMNIIESIHIHPALPEVVQRAFQSLREV